MNKNIVLILSIFCFSLFFSEYSHAQKEKEDITCKQAYDLIKKHQGDTNFVIIDFRTEEMYSNGHIKGATVFDVFSDKIDTWLNKLNRNKTYLLYCNAGYRSGIALKKMKEMKFKKLFHLYEGIKVWKNEGYETKEN